MSIHGKKFFRAFFKNIDIFRKMHYNVVMEKIYQLAIVGGGAAGLFLACDAPAENMLLIERGERVGRKLSSTGNGQGNITNLKASETTYFSSSDVSRVQEIVKAYDQTSLMTRLKELGLLLTADERGRVYPAGRQASAITDALRFYLDFSSVQTLLKAQVTEIEKKNGVFVITAGGEKYYAENVALCTGGKAAKNFGTDGTAYALAQRFGHTLTPLYPSLVQLKTDTAHTKTLKGIRVSPAKVTAKWQGGEEAVEGDIIFTDYGVSGDAIFRLSAFFSDKLDKKAALSIDFLPEFTTVQIENALLEKSRRFPKIPSGELLCGMLNNQIARAVAKRAGGVDLGTMARTVKDFSLTVTGTLGFDYAQVTKGGIPLNETDERLQSKLVEGLYFAGEILDADGQCGGFNLQWAYSSARTVSAAIKAKYQKERGQV